MASPANSMLPLVTSPRSARSRLEIAFSVVVLPGAVGAEEGNDAPSATDSDTPRNTRMT